MQTWPKTFVFLFLAIAVSTTACKKALTYKDKSYENQNVTRAASEANLPTALWDLLAAGGSDESTEFVPLRVYLAEKTAGILGGHNVELSYGESGGELDLKDFVQEKNGSFFIAMEPVTEAKEPEKGKESAKAEKSGEKGSEKANEKANEKAGEKPAEKAESKEPAKEPAKEKQSSAPAFKVYFLSHSKHRKIGDQKFGSGCSTYFDITSYFEKSMAGEGFMVNTSQQRDVSALAGTYFFVINQNGRLLLSQLNVKDSRYKSLQCVNSLKTGSHEDN